MLNITKNNDNMRYYIDVELLKEEEYSEYAGYFQLERACSQTNIFNE